MNFRLLSSALLTLGLTAAACDAPDASSSPSDQGETELADDTPHPHAAPGQPIDLGPVDLEIEQHTDEADAPAGARSLADRDDFLVWPGGVVPYKLAPSFDPEYKLHAMTLEKVYQAMDYIQQHSRVRFRAKTAADTDYVLLRPSSTLGGTSCDVGRHAGENVCTFEINQNLTRATYIHELTHVLGFYHEQQRADRDENLIFSYECVAGTEAVSRHFAIKQGFNFGMPFDPRSIMLSSSYDHCITGADVPKCICMPLKYRQSPVVPCPGGVCTNTANGTLITGSKNIWSQSDLDAVHLSYSRSLGADEAGDAYGAAVAVGDFDDDGVDDLAVGAPAEAPDADPASGAVYLYRGTPRGLVPWRTITQETRPIDQAGELLNAIGRNDAGDRFGASLAAGDFDHDGVTDLAIGAPGEATTATNAGAGAVFFFRGFAHKASDARYGLIAWKNITQGTVGNAQEAGDNFGETLAAGDFNNDGRTDLAVGVPHESVGTIKTGTVVVLHQDTAGVLVDGWQDLKPLAGHNGDLFGAALAVGDLNQDGIQDLVVGAPYSDGATETDIGAVQIHLGAMAGLHTDGRVIDASAFPSPERGGAFGFALAVGDLDNNGFDDLAVGAPGAGSGQVALFKGIEGGAPIAWDRRNAPDAGISATNDDRYGATLLIRPLLGTKNELVVGAPRFAAIPGQPSNSSVYVFRTLPVGAGPPTLQARASHPGVFGFALAVGDFKHDGHLHLVAGAPSNEPGGSAFVYETRDNSLFSYQTWRQSVAPDFRH